MDEISEVQREKVKLAATFMNNVGVACFGVGGLAPAISIIGAGNDPTNWRPLLAIVIFIAAFGFLGVMAHRMGAKTLEALAPPGTPLDQLRFPQLKKAKPQKQPNPL